MRFFSKLFPSRTKREGEFFAQVFQITEIKPTDLSLYKLAFRHSSASKKITENSCLQNNERLEFLGDAILGAIVAQHLYAKYPKQNEGFLTSMRSKIVSRKNLNHIANDLGLTHLVISKLDTRKPAKSLGGDALEALIGALYLDKGYDDCKAFILMRVINKDLSLSALENQIISYKGVFIEWAQKEKRTFDFKLADQWGKQHSMTFKMLLLVDNIEIANGTGSSKKRAEEAAAQKACDLLKINQ